MKRVLGEENEFHKDESLEFQSHSLSCILTTRGNIIKKKHGCLQLPERMQLHEKSQHCSLQPCHSTREQKDGDSRKMTDAKLHRDSVGEFVLVGLPL